MYKRITVILLTASLFLLIREGVTSWQGLESTVPPVKAVKKLAAPGGAQKQVSFYPKVPKKLPDLNQGYLFNEERFLASEGEGEKEEN